ncbi:hypothetical protein ZEAMMB73_Zm00001d029991, partial [Zea mays]
MLHPTTHLRRLTSKSSRSTTTTTGRHSLSYPSVSSSTSDDESPLAAELFPTAGAPTLLSVARSLAVASPAPSAAAVLNFLRRLPHDASPHVFPHLIAALARSPLPILALRLFLSPPTSAATTHHCFNSSLLRFSLPQHLLPAFFAHSLRRFSGLTPTLLSFNLLLKCICSSDKFTYSTIVSALADAGRVDDALALVHEMVVDGILAAEAFNPVLKAMLRTGEVDRALKVWETMVAAK